MRLDVRLDVHLKQTCYKSVKHSSALIHIPSDYRSGMYAWFLKGQKHQDIFSKLKGTLWGNFYWSISRAPRQ